MKVEYSLEKNATQDISSVSTKQTAASTRTLLVSSHGAFTACVLVLSCCFSCVLFFFIHCFRLFSCNFTLFNSAFLSDSFTPTLKTEDGFRWRAGSEASSPEHTDLDNRDETQPTRIRKYNQSLQTLKPFRCSSSQSVSLNTYCVCCDALVYCVMNIFRQHVQR